MRSAIVALVTIIALMTSVLAQSSRKILVLPLDGNASAAQKDGLNSAVQKMAKDKMGGEVTVGETTFSETAAAVGCDPNLASCADQVRSTLAVDELVYGSATTADGNTTVTINRVSAGNPAPKTQLTVIKDSDSADQASSGLEPLFTASEGDGSGSGSGSGSAARPRVGSSFFSTKERKLGVAFLAGGVISLVIGFSLWSGASSLQDDIDDHPKSTIAEIEDLKELEDRAGSKALWGNVFVVIGLAASGVGGYFLWKDRKNRQAAATVAPVAPDGNAGMTFVLRGAW